VTDNKTTALFNKIGAILKKHLDRLFGSRLLSFSAFTISGNISMGAGVAIVAILRQFQDSAALFYTLKDFILVSICFAAALLSAKYRNMFVGLLTCLPMTLAAIAIPTIINDPEFSQNAAFPLLPVIIALSFLSDFIAIALIRKMFNSLVTTVSTIRALLTALLLVAFGATIVLFPLSFRSEEGNPVDVAIDQLSIANLATALLCLVPTIFLVIVLLQKLTWPLWSRVIYPLCRFKIVSNRKALISFGVLCLTFAFNLEEVGLNAILALFSKGG
jgi:hypothetical protein